MILLSAIFAKDNVEIKFKTESEMSFKQFYGILKFGIKYNW